MCWSHHRRRERWMFLNKRDPPTGQRPPEAGGVGAGGALSRAGGGVSAAASGVCHPDPPPGHAAATPAGLPAALPGSGSRWDGSRERDPEPSPQDPDTPPPAPAHLLNSGEGKSALMRTHFLRPRVRVAGGKDHELPANRLCTHNGSINVHARPLAGIRGAWGRPLTFKRKHAFPQSLPGRDRKNQSFWGVWPPSPGSCLSDYLLGLRFGPCPGSPPSTPAAQRRRPACPALRPTFPPDATLRGRASTPRVAVCHPSPHPGARPPPVLL